MSDPISVVHVAANKGTRIMRKVKWIGLLIIGVSLSTAGFADEATFPEEYSVQALPDAVTVESLLAKPAYASFLQLRRPVEATTSANDRLQPIADIDFQDNSVLGRVSKLRNVSLLTLAKAGQTRLFLGVNDDGLVGLHLIAIPKRKDDRYLSLVRMPYLKENEPDSHDR